MELMKHEDLAGHQEHQELAEISPITCLVMCSWSRMLACNPGVRLLSFRNCKALALLLFRTSALITRAQCGRVGRCAQ